jgi:hypothetical protein
MQENHALSIQTTSFVGALVSSVLAITPIITAIFMLVSICTGVILIYKFLRGKK